MPRLRLVQSGIQRSYAAKPKDPTKMRLPITPTILPKIKEHWSPQCADLDNVTPWAAATLCFFSFSGQERSLFQA